MICLFSSLLIVAILKHNDDMICRSPEYNLDMGNLEDICRKLIGQMDENQFEFYKNIYENLLEKEGKHMDSYENFNLAVKILSHQNTEIPRSH